MTTPRALRLEEASRDEPTSDAPSSPSGHRDAGPMPSPQLDVDARVATRTAVFHPEG